MSQEGVVEGVCPEGRVEDELAEVKIIVDTNLQEVAVLLRNACCRVCVLSLRACE